VRSLGVLMVGNASDEMDERGRPVSGDTLLLLLNAHFEEVPFVLPRVGDVHGWVRAIDTIASDPPECRFEGGARYPLQGRSLAVLKLEQERRRRQSDSHTRSAAAIDSHADAVSAPAPQPPRAPAEPHGDDTVLGADFLDAPYDLPGADD
jgi:hypothetical protein